MIRRLHYQIHRHYIWPRQRRYCILVQHYNAEEITHEELKISILKSCSGCRSSVAPISNEHHIVYNHTECHVIVDYSQGRNKHFPPLYEKISQ